ncbi:T9SS type A sorting domain-containing protein [Sphingobacteriaceae bacterium AH-315-L07]|nr:T9SS type A sorting domain-containing protein [Sphingobacteriaceae bacterium AH-315-L07]
MKIFILALFIYILCFLQVNAQHRKCSTDQFHQSINKKYPEFKKLRQLSEIEIQNWIKHNANSERKGSIITIPVVVHVVYNRDNQNISYEQINSQLEVFNRDFRKLNNDTLDADHPYWQYVADSEIEFCLAHTGPDGNYTSGITRTYTDTTSFSGDYHPQAKNEDFTSNVYFSDKGGVDNWPPDKYLNIWVCKMNDLLGWANYPYVLGLDSALDGLVMDYRYFGDTNTIAPYDYGRTATHEIGHWLNLIHTFGSALDEESGICGSDSVADTPPQDTYNFDCPTFPHITCSNGAYGDMFMNFMDYANDSCAVMFTKGQADRMKASLNLYRSGLINSNLCNPPDGFEENSIVTSFTIYPNPVSDQLNIEYTLTNTENVKITLYNSLGQVVVVLFDEKQTAEEHNSRFSINLPSGIYFMNFRTSKDNFCKVIYKP